uniref:hypothetical chloroplast RF20 n=1 Tax=Ochrosphaera neapolitana TaxID=35137 RepID=UPI00286A85D5|nr:hypothetical chloroplast RF20 [Ochrosphaera neapolitana]WKK50160.1 hypothetical chloroplast RF20 [Ochrosphaera neapolitana]
MIPNLICFFGGFFLSGIIDTTINGFYQFPFIASTFLVFVLEELSKKYYALFYKKPFRFFQTNNDIIRAVDNINYTKMGIIYGLIVDAFKLGS